MPLTHLKLNVTGPRPWPTSTNQAADPLRRSMPQTHLAHSRSLCSDLAVIDPRQELLLLATGKSLKLSLSLPHLSLASILNQNHCGSVIYCCRMWYIAENGSVTTCFLLVGWVWGILLQCYIIYIFIVHENFFFFWMIYNNICSDCGCDLYFVGCFFFFFSSCCGLMMVVGVADGRGGCGWYC